MLTLLLLRHAKSGWDDPDLPDFDRPLSKRGVKAAGLMGKYLAKTEFLPEQTLCSDAVRTRATLALVASELEQAPVNVSYHSELYLADPSVLLHHIQSADKETKTLLMVTHNPGLHALSLALIGGGDRKGLHEMAMKYPTAALSIIRFDLTNWTDIKPASGTLVTFKAPRDLD